MRLIGLLISFTIMLQVSIAGELPKDITLAIKSGNTKELAQYFNSNIELVLLDKEDVYSKTQATVILDEFFKKHKPTNFELVHQGGKEGAQYYIGKLTTSEDSFRVCFFLKTINKKTLIHKLMIEEGDDE